MESVPHVRPVHTHRNGPNNMPAGGRQPHSRNNWVTSESGQRGGINTTFHGEGERWERGGHRGGRARGVSRGIARGGRGRFSNVSLRLNGASRQEIGPRDNNLDEAMEPTVMEEASGPEEPVLETQEERDKFYQEVCVWHICLLFCACSTTFILAREGS